MFKQYNSPNCSTGDVALRIWNNRLDFGTVWIRFRIDTGPCSVSDSQYVVRSFLLFAEHRVVIFKTLEKKTVTDIIVIDSRKLACGARRDITITIRPYVTELFLAVSRDQQVRPQSTSVVKLEVYWHSF